MVEHRLSKSDKRSQQALHMCLKLADTDSIQVGDDCLVFVAVDTRVEQRHLTSKASWSMILSDRKHVLWMLYFSIPWYRISQQIAGIQHNPLHYWKCISLIMDDAKFGFSSFAEQWNGRLAMMGFIIGLGTELLTGQSILHQIGLG